MKVEIIPVFLKYGEYVPNKELMKEREVYISEEFNTSIHLCLCGCKELVVMPLNKSYGWTYTKDNGKVSFTPSVGNYSFPCRSHYIITNNIANFV